MSYYGPPPQRVLEQRVLWYVMMVILALTAIVRILGLDLAGALLSALMLWFAIVMNRDGMQELGKYALVFAVLCSLNLFFDALPLVAELGGGRVERTVRSVGGNKTADGSTRTTYELTTRTLPFLDISQGFVYNMQSLSLILSPIAMSLGLYLSLSAHNEMARLIQNYSDDSGNSISSGRSTPERNRSRSPGMAPNGSSAAVGERRPLLPAGAASVSGDAGGPTTVAARDTMEKFQGQAYRLSYASVEP
eukprot:TRINITY_DN73544_c0_g1_i1.p1 TRINITY_DN73544_c0_g1~~TRINITY_DN73544_c0_g1_i1.p1  ORF type:complete len:282 (+),score=57.96 TRINITY_DN73544_c0_g1_i1:101-847(+)